MKTFVWQKEVVIYQRVAAEDRREAYGKLKRHYRNIEKKLIEWRGRDRRAVRLGS